jgi:hypothetical protein
MERALWIQLPIVSDLFYSCSCNDKTRTQLKVVILRNWLAACKSAGSVDASGLSEADLIACFRLALQTSGKVANNRHPSSHWGALDLKQFSLMLLLLSARRLGRSSQSIDATSCSTEWVEAVANMLVAVGFVSNFSAHEHPPATTSPPPPRKMQREAHFRSPNASYLRNLMCKTQVDNPILPHELLSRSFSRAGIHSREARIDGSASNHNHRVEAGKPMKFLWEPQLFSSNAEVMSSPGPYELPSYMRRDWEVHRLRKCRTGKISMLLGLPPSRGRTARTFSDIPFIGQPQEVTCVPSFNSRLQPSCLLFAHRSMKLHSGTLKYPAPRHQLRGPAL